MRVARVGERVHRRHAIIRAEDAVLAVAGGGEAEGRVLVVQRVVVAAAEERAQAQGRLGHRSDEVPAQDDGGVAVGDEQLLLDHRAVGQAIAPARPRLVFERFDSRSAIGMNYIGAVVLGGDGKGSTRRFHPRVEAVN